MEWLQDLLQGNSVAHTFLVLSVVIAAGVALGKLRIYGISLGVTFVLFAGILLGHLGFVVDHVILNFVRDFGLILFVFAIGLQVGPGFFASFSKAGLTFNLLAVAVVLLNVAVTLIVHYAGHVSMPMAVGIMSGAVTNTPGLGAAQQALAQIGAADPSFEIPGIGLGYAVAYPFGVLGIIFSFFLIRKIFRISILSEQDGVQQKHKRDENTPRRFNLVVGNPRIFGATLKKVRSTLNADLVVSRVMHDNQVIIPASDTVLHEGDILLVIASAPDIEKIKLLIGDESPVDIAKAPCRLVSRQIIVTRDAVVGKRLGSLRLRNIYSINITRVYRAGVEFIPDPNILLQMGDKLTVVGEEDNIQAVAGVIGNSIKRLEEPNIVPMFIGITLGILIGSIPITLPGIPMPVKLGLAGGPLIVAILLSRYGFKYHLISYTTQSANLMLREIGIVLFLASVGLGAGDKFVATLLSGEGLMWIASGCLITILPLLIIGSLARMRYKKNYFEICGLLAGSTTDPPALAFANSAAGSDAPAVTYATVYPLVMFLRVVAAQLLILLVR
jgi:putative transport protein